ncbi:hypothetical protein AZH53_09760 [Methanomicrobiaceae archaeon CYW5]|uniref:hypothetical protein n=1 Tax=Methanovulcanius yangii TaxID=1789227 RepID=UPI0029CA6EFE|nr:hypothetical protein [Methanovulcanius yangii]MBT8508689.1 hypothetical protein [Methanovulcanius yangii]
MEIAENTETLQGWMNDGASYLRLDNYEKALNAFDSAIEIDQFYPLAYIEKEKCLRKMGRFSEADEVCAIIADLQSETVLGSDFPPHDPYHHITHLLCENGNFSDVSELMEAYTAPLKDLISGFNQSSLQISGQYNDAHLQHAYLLYYYPYYIETIYREMLLISPNYLSNSSSHHLGICFYCCGPAPEYMGTLKFISEKQKNYRHISVSFFEKSQWDETRDECIRSISPHYYGNESLNITTNSRHLNILTLRNAGIIAKYPEIRTSNLHIFQNCMRDLIQFSEKTEDVLELLKSIFMALRPGGILIIVEMYYPQTKLFLNKFEEFIRESGTGTILQQISEKKTYQPNFKKPDEIRLFFTGKINRDRRYTNYFSFIAMRT